MEGRRWSTSPTGNSPLSEHNSSSSSSWLSPSSRKSSSIYFSLHTGDGSGSPRRPHHKHRPSDDDHQTRALWPSSSSKKLLDPPPSYNASTFASRQRISISDQSKDQGGMTPRKSLAAKKPATPPSPSSHSSSFRRSDSGIDLPSPEPRSGRAGVGSFLAQGLTSFFRKQRLPSPPSRPGLRSPLKERASRESPAVDVLDGEIHRHQLRILHNYLVQWMFVNAGTLVFNNIKSANAQNLLVNAWLRLSELCALVAKKQMQLDREKLIFKLSKLLCHQTKALERWGATERLHVAALSSTKDSLQAAVCRLPITDRVKADPTLLSISLQQAAKIASAINGDVAKCHSMVQSRAHIVAELAEVVATEKPLLQECIDLLSLVSTLQAHDDSLRSHIIQLKSCTAKRVDEQKRFAVEQGLDVQTTVNSAYN